MACLGKFPDDVFPVRTGHDVVVRNLGIKLRKPVMMLRNQHHVLHARVLGKLHPGVRVIVNRIKFLVVIVVDRVPCTRAMLINVPGPIAVAAPTDLLGADGARTPMDKHAELGVTEPLHAGIVILRGLSPLRYMAQVYHFLDRFLGMASAGPAAQGKQDEHQDPEVFCECYQGETFRHTV